MASLNDNDGTQGSSNVAVNACLEPLMVVVTVAVTIPSGWLLPNRVGATRPVASVLTTPT